MTISTLYQTQLLSNSYQKTYQSYSDNIKQLTTEKKYSYYYEMGDSASIVSSIEHEMETRQQYMQNSKDVGSYLLSQEEALKSIINTVTDFKQTLTGMQNGGSAALTKNAFISKYKNVCQELQQLMNSRHASTGEYFFSGDLLKDTPIDLTKVPDGMPGMDLNASVSNLYYLGNNGVKQDLIAEKRVLTYGINGDNSGFEKTIRAVKMLIRGDIFDKSDIISKAIDLTSDAIDDLAILKSNIGYKHKTVEDMQKHHQTVNDNLMTTLASLNGVKKEDILLEIGNQRTSIETMFAAIGGFQKLNIIPYIQSIIN